MIDPDQNNEEEDKYDYGVIILNEGAQSSGSLSYLNEELTSIENNLFETVNPDMDLGKFLQSMFFDDANAYIISNGSNYCSRSLYFQT